jgi:vanillate O-demethylase ferredoxin subunit
MGALAPGDRLRITAPQSHFDLSRGRPDYLLVAGGIGVTPLIGMARALVPHPRARMLYAGRSRAHMPYLNQLAALLGGRLAVFSDAEGTRIDLATAFTELHPEGEAYICGPAPMLAAARLAWRDAGRPEALLRFETFGSGGLRDPEPFSVHVRDHGVTLQVPRDASLLDALALAGIDVAQDCLRGECGLCAVDVIGPAELDHRDVFLSETQRAACHQICACVSRAVGQVTIDTGFRPSLARVHSAAASA